LTAVKGGATKIRNLQIEIGVEEEVLRFYVAVNHICGMEKLESLGCLSCSLESLRQRNRIVFGKNKILQTAIAHVFHSKDALFWIPIDDLN
jgi:hypothetical protein